MQKVLIDKSINDSYKYCQDITYKHYENFPVASKLLPKKLRSPIIAIYSYARYADDIVDSPYLNEQEKFDKINKLEEIIIKIEKLNYKEIILITNNFNELKFLSHLKKSILDNNLSINLLLDLLKAFKQDITKYKYQNLNEVLDYCKYSANPIGRLLLELNNIKNSDALNASDAICTALQIINFIQDIKSDFNERKRCYMPLDILEKFNIKIDNINSKNPNINWIQVKNELLLFSEQLILNNSNKLLKNLNGRFRLELKAIINSALLLVNKFKKYNYNKDNIFERPYLNKLDFIKIFFKTMFR